MLEWRTEYDQELAELMTQEAERQKPIELLPIRADYWPEAILFMSAALFGGFVWWVIS